MIYVIDLIIIIVFLSVYNTDNVERLTLMHKNNISVYLSSISLEASFQYIKSSKYTKLF
jgi:hypothetical protein